MKNKEDLEVIIIEGCDLAGKSHLFNSIIKSFPGMGIKITDRPKDGSPFERKKIKEYYWSVLSFINKNYQNKTIVLDRFFPSEMVYSLPKRKYEAMFDPDFVNIEKSIRARKHLLIYCDPGLPTILERLKSRGDDYVNGEALADLYERYKYFLENTKMNVLRLDKNKPVEQLIEQVKKYVR
jgi:thymidylate kinase